ncbi:methylmalonyl-CoA mutase family protein, partial [Paenisporosarcina sp.]|uniref:methylmalonyl-CoA mutase family protein n=1 Tax=Paenisporosarcina sp. TaxID=1932001 RepID=UPI003C77B3A0
MKPNFKAVELEKIVSQQKTSSTTDHSFLTNEGIRLNSRYAKDDVATLEHLSDFPGIAPHTRGPYPTMYVSRPWTVRQYAG